MYNIEMYNIESWNVQCWKFMFYIMFIFYIPCNILITLAKKRDKVSIAIMSSNFILCGLFGCTT